MPLSATSPSQHALLTSFLYVGGGEVWVVAQGIDPASVTFEEERVGGALLVVDAQGEPASAQAVAERGLRIAICVPQV